MTDAGLIQKSGGMRVMDVFPTWITRAGLRFLLISDVLVVGALAPSYLAPVGIAYSLGSVLFAISQGLLLGCLIESVAALKRGQRASIAIILRDGLGFGLAFGIVFALLCQLGPSILGFLGQRSEISNQGGWILALLGFGLPLHYLFVALGYVLEAMGKHHAVAAWVAFGFTVNLGLAVALPAAFADTQEGATFLIVTSTVIVRLVILIGLVVYVLRQIDLSAYGAGSLPRWTMASGRNLRRVGRAAGASLAVESAAFAALSVFAGWLGPVALAAYTLLNNLVSLIFSLALAVAVVTSAQVAGAYALADRLAARRGFVFGLSLALALMSGFGLLAYLLRYDFIALSTSDPAAMAVAVPLVGLVSLLMLGDGGQAVAANALRGLGDAWPATVIHLTCYLVLMVAGGWYLAIPLERGVRGLLEATAVASFTVLGVLSWRFYYLTSATSFAKLA
jgi:MATE family multidrug resistance protein